MASKTYTQPLADVRVATDVVVFTAGAGALKVLLVERSEPPFEGCPALPGGFLWEGETSRQSAERILAAKAGVRDVFVEQLYTFDAPGRDPRGRIVSIVYYALVPEDRLEIENGASRRPGFALESQKGASRRKGLAGEGKEEMEAQTVLPHEGLDGSGTEKPALFPVREIPPLAFDHGEILAYAVGRLRAKIAYTNAIYSLLPPVFTFTQLQTAYETVLERPLEKRNFRKKYLGLGMIEPIEERLAGTRYRPPQLYRFKADAPAELPSPFL